MWNPVKPSEGHDDNRFEGPRQNRPPGRQAQVTAGDSARMNRVAGKFASITDVRQRFGIAAMCKHMIHVLINQVCFFDILHIILLEREHVRPVVDKGCGELTARFATQADLEQMIRDTRWDIDDAKLRYFASGDLCLLSFVGGKLAGYTWVHTLGRPELVPGLTLSVPSCYIYNYSALTLPEFRGAGLQPFRHRELLGRPEYGERRGLIGYVRYTNFASQNGQQKSGYRKVGTIWLLGTPFGLKSRLSRSLRDLNLTRLDRR